MNPDQKILALQAKHPKNEFKKLFLI